MKALWNSFVVAFSMYSKIPMPKADWNKDNMKYAMCFFPLVGVIIGLVVSGWLYITNYYEIGIILTSVVVVIIPIVITGGIHLDGFCDTVDAISSHQPKERKLEILKDPNTGAFALIFCVVYLLLSFALIAEIILKTSTLNFNRNIFVICVGFVLSRSLSGLSVVSFQGAKKTGTLTTFSSMADKKKVQAVLIVYIVVSFLLMLDASVILGITSFVVSLIVFLYYRIMSYKEFGGITGDLAGYFLQLCELSILISIAVVQLF